MAPTTPESESTGMTGVHVAILVICVFVFAAILVALMIWCYRSDKRRAEVGRQISRTPTPTGTRILNIPAGPGSRGNMAEVPRQGIFPAPTPARGTTLTDNPGGVGGSSATRPRNSSPDSAAAQGRASTWSPRQYGQGTPGTRPQKSVPRPGAVPARSALSSRSGVPNAVVRPQTGSSAGSAGQGYWYAR